MLRSIGIIPSLLGAGVIITIVICKYLNSPRIYLLIIILASMFYQINTNKRDNKKSNFEETLINISRFIIITGIMGYITVKIIGFFYSGFD